MSMQYHFVDKDHYKSNIVIDSAVLVEDGVVWDEGEVQMSLCYASDDTTLIENNNETYLSTADDGNETQYFSILDTTNQTTLNELNDITLYTNGDVDDSVEAAEQHEIDDISTLEAQQNVYAISGSEDLYAFQVAYDEEGNMQRYRYILRPNENGDYETVPESLELVSADSEIELAEPQIIPSEVPEPEVDNSTRIPLRNNEVIVKTEEFAQDTNEDVENPCNINEDGYDELQVNEDEDNESFEESCTFKRNVDNTTGIVQQNLLSVKKLEVTDYESDESNSHSAYDQANDNMLQDKKSAVAASSSSQNSPIQTEELGLRNFEHVYTVQSEVTNGNEEPEVSDDAIEEEQLIITDQPELRDGDDDRSKSSNSDFSGDRSESNKNVEFVEAVHDNESDADEFQMVDGVHVTADADDGNEEIVHGVETFGGKDCEQQILRLQDNFPVLQSAAIDFKVRNPTNKNGKKVKNLMYYVVKNPEKENVATISQLVNNKVIKANPRSVLKSSFSFFEQKKEDAKTPTPVVNTEKKPLKNKDNQARLLHNFIAKTTIIHAPVRQERLPRKQTIKPVERADEEIIVQEVVVSSNGFIETSQDGVVKSKVPLKPTQFVQVTDSDEDYNSKREQKRKKKKKKRRSKITEIVISDTEEELSDDNIVQIDLSAESDEEAEENENNATNTNAKKPSGLPESSSGSAFSSSDIAKRKRGRPRKRQNSPVGETSAADSSSSKKFKSTTDSENSDLPTTSKPEFDNVKTTWKCNKCPKVFPSQGSLKTHMQFHTFHKPNIKQNLFHNSSTSKRNNHKCSICHEVFKNNYLLTKHSKEHNDSNKFECGICKRLFSDRLQLINHKRNHVKEQMVKSTTLPKNSPKNKKSLGIKLNKTSTNEGKHKCIFCSKEFTSSMLLNAHLRTHKRFTCLTCTATFISKLALEDHVQRNCVRKPKVQVRHLSLKTKTGKSFVAPGNKSLRRVSLRKSNGKVKRLTIASTGSSDKDQKTTPIANPIALKCDKCSMVFKSHANLFRHKVVKHGLETPDKRIKDGRNKKELRKEVPGHGSVPIGEKIVKALTNLRTLK